MLNNERGQLLDQLIVTRKNGGQRKLICELMGQEYVPKKKRKKSDSAAGEVKKWSVFYYSFFFDTNTVIFTNR